MQWPPYKSRDDYRTMTDYELVEQARLHEGIEGTPTEELAIVLAERLQCAGGSTPCECPECGANLE